jgi:hypothetical protein
LKLIREDSKNISYEFVGKRNFEYNKDKWWIILGNVSESLTSAYASIDA